MSFFVLVIFLQVEVKQEEDDDCEVTFMGKAGPSQTSSVDWAPLLSVLEQSGYTLSLGRGNMGHNRNGGGVWRGRFPRARGNGRRGRRGGGGGRRGRGGHWEDRRRRDNYWY